MKTYLNRTNHLTEVWGDFHLMLDINFFVWYTVFTQRKER